jgi:hypothetical protein
MNSNPFSLHERFTARIDFVGLEKEPVIVIDNFLQDPEALVEYAAANRDKFTHQVSSYYPGLRMPCSLEFMKTIYGHLSKYIAEAFQLPRIQAMQSFFSVVTLPPQKLDFLQRIPHFDTPYKTSIAMIHYLCSDKFGGTSLYRHKSTGFEFIDQSRVQQYSDVLNREVQQHGLPGPAYINGDTAQYEKIASYKAAFNRILVYRSSSLHSGDITQDYARDPDPRTGRLTITSFMK